MRSFEVKSVFSDSLTTHLQQWGPAPHCFLVLYLHLTTTTLELETKTVRYMKNKLQYFPSQM